MDNPDQTSTPQVIFSHYSLPPFFKLLVLGLILLITLLFILYAKGYFRKTTTATEKIVVQCPTPIEFCAKVTALKLNLPKNKQKNDGLGWVLPKNTVIKAAFDGNFKQQKIFGATPAARLITITSPLGRFEARYIFAVDKQSDTSLNLPENKKTVKAGDTLTTIPGIPLTSPGYNGATLQFYIIDKVANSRMVLLLPEELKQKIKLPKK